jgi:hypothetical protein
LALTSMKWGVTYFRVQRIPDRSQLFHLPKPEQFRALKICWEGRGGLFLKAPKSCLIPWNGSVALR